MRRMLAAAGTVALLAALPATARAAEYCVGDPRCEPSNHYITITDAINAAALDSARDTIYVRNTHTENLTVSPGNPVDIVGTGDAKLLSSGALPRGVTIEEPTSTISNFTVELPVAQNSYLGLYLIGATARNVTVVAEAGTGYFNHTGVYLEGGTFEGGVVDLPLTREDTGIFSLNGALSTIRDSTVAGGVGINFGGPNNARIERTSATGESGIIASGGTLDVTDTVIRNQRIGTVLLPPPGLHVLSTTGGSTTVRARHLTILGPPAADTHGVRVQNDVDFMTATLTLRDSIVRGHELDLVRQSTRGEATLNADYTDFRSMGGENTAPGTGSFAFGEHNLDIDPMFASATDLRLDPCSPLIDRGSPDALAAGDSTTDRGGRPRVVDGDANGSVIGDIGAFEHQAPPTCPGATPDPDPPDPEVTPELTELTVVPGALRPARRGPSTKAIPRRGRRGAVVSYTLNVPATAGFSVRRRKPGRRAANGRCVKPTRRNRTRPRCTRTRPVPGSFTHSGVAGVNQFVFTGRLDRRRLRRGRYVLRGVPQAGTLTGAVASRRFRVRR